MPARIPLRELIPDERNEMHRIATARTAPAGLVERARIVLGAADGKPVGVIAAEVNVFRSSVSAWVRRFNPPLNVHSWDLKSLAFRRCDQEGLSRSVERSSS